MRRRAKIINFSIIYGTSAFSLAKELGTSAGEAQKFIDRYYEKYPKVQEFLEKMVEDTRDKGLFRDDLRPHPSGARAQAGGQDHPAGRAPHRPQQSHPGLGRRHHEEGDARRLGGR